MSHGPHGIKSLKTLNVFNPIPLSQTASYSDVIGPTAASGGVKQKLLLGNSLMMVGLENFPLRTFFLEYLATLLLSINCYFL